MEGSEGLWMARKAHAQYRESSHFSGYIYTVFYRQTWASSTCSLSQQKLCDCNAVVPRLISSGLVWFSNCSHMASARGENGQNCWFVSLSVCDTAFFFFFWDGQLLAGSWSTNTALSVPISCRTGGKGKPLLTTFLDCTWITNCFASGYQSFATAYARSWPHL